MADKALPRGIERLPSGHYRVRYTGPDGRRRSIGTYRTLRMAKAALDKARADVVSGDWIDPNRANITLDEWHALWSPERGVRETTRLGDEDRWRLHIKPYLGRYELARLTPFAIAKWLRRLEQDGRSAALQRKAHTLLKTALNAAIHDGRMRSNPCVVTSAPKVDRPRWVLLTRPQFEAIHNALPDPQSQLIALLAAYGGLRWSEIMGLQRRDLNPFAGTLTVSRGVTTARGRLFVGAPKSHQRRTVPLHPRLLTALNEHVNTRQMFPQAYLFTSPEGGQIRHSNWRRRVWLPALSTAGVTCRFHDLRHSCASWLLEGGATLAQVRDMLGHSSVTVTELYLHTDAESLAAAVSRAL
jgi:integrase